jgi:hypothetical protein
VDAILYDMDGNYFMSMMYKCPMTSVGKNQVTQVDQLYGEATTLINIMPKKPIIYLTGYPSETLAVNKKEKKHKKEVVKKRSLNIFLNKSNIIYQSIKEYLTYIQVIDIEWKPKFENYEKIITDCHDGIYLNDNSIVDVVDDVIIDDSSMDIFYGCSNYIKKYLEKCKKEQEKLEYA